MIVVVSEAGALQLLMPTLRALIVQATGMTEKLAPFALAMTTFDVVLTLLEDASGDKKKVVPATAGDLD